MQDYQGNSKKEKLENLKPEKKIERIVQGEVLVQKRGIGRKFKDLFIMADLRSVMQYVAMDVLLPAARNMIVDASHKGVERMMYGESAMRRRSAGMGSRVTYNNPINRGAREVVSRMAPAGATGGMVSRGRGLHEDFIISSREDADLVLERMNDVIDTYEVVSVSDFNELVGFQGSHTDEKWGWYSLQGVQVRQTREGYVIDLPPAEPIS